MRYNQLGKTGIKLSEICYGAWAIGGWLWGVADKTDALRSIKKSIELGITSIDTAPIYGFGESELIVGEAIKSESRDKLQILTKYGLRWNETRGIFYFNSEDNQGKPLSIYKNASKDSIIYECEQSLKRLGTDYIDLYQIHWPDSSTSISETMEAISLLIQQGKIRAAGVCNYNVELLEESLKSNIIVTNQIPYSMVKREIEKEIVPFCVSNNIGILAYSPLQRGILTGKITPDFQFKKGDNRPDTPYYKKENIIRINEFLKQIKPMANERKITLSQLVINWTLQQTGIVSALVGARNESQVEENAKSAEFRLSRVEINLINKELNRLILE